MPISARCSLKSPFQHLIRKYLPGIRTSTSTAWMVVLAAEMLGANKGVGFLVVRGMEGNDLPLVLVAMITIGVIGALLAIITGFIERRLCPWDRKK